MGHSGVSHHENDALGAYLAHGNVRPSQEFLTDFSDTVRSGSLRNRVAFAEAQLDLAVINPTETPKRIDEAAAALDGVRLLADYRYRYGGKDDRRGAGREAIESQLRLAELPNWFRVATGESPENEYTTLLEAANYSLRYLRADDPNPESKLIEFVPVLLGARAKEKGLTTSWAGRMALMREDETTTASPRQTPTWDTGLSRIFGASDFLSPDLRIDVKKSRVRQGESAKASSGGVTLMIAKQYGFDEPISVIKGCVVEQGIRPRRTPGMNIKPASTAELDIITAKIYKRLFPKLAKVA